MSDFNVSDIAGPAYLASRTDTLHGKTSSGYAQSSDKLIVEIFPEPEQQSERVRTILEHLISPGQEVGGDSRLLIPSNQNVVTAEEQIGGQVRTRQC